MYLRRIRELNASLPRLRELDNSQRKDNNFSLALTELDDFLENIDHIKLYAKFQARDSKINVIAFIDNKSRVSSKTIALARRRVRSRMARWFF